MTSKLPTLNQLAIHRATQILESWWHEDSGEFQEEHNLTDEELEAVLSTAVKVVIL